MKAVVIEVLTDMLEMAGDTRLVLHMARCPSCGESDHCLNNLIEEYKDSLEAELTCRDCLEPFTLYVRAGPLH